MIKGGKKAITSEPQNAENTNKDQNFLLKGALNDVKTPQDAITLIKAEADRISEIIEKLCIPNNDVTFSDLPEENGIRAAMRDKIAPQMIEASNSFEELYSVLKKIGEISGSNGKVYSFNQLVDTIEAVRENTLDIDYITRNYGLRGVVIRLLDEAKKPIPEDGNPPSTSGKMAVFSPKKPLVRAGEKGGTPEPKGPKPPNNPHTAAQKKQDLISQEDKPQKKPDNTPPPIDPEELSKKNPELYRPNGFPRTGVRRSILRARKRSFQLVTILRYTHDKYVIVKNVDNKFMKIPVVDLINPRTGKLFKENEEGDRGGNNSNNNREHNK